MAAKLIDSKAANGMPLHILASSFLFVIIIQTYAMLLLIVNLFVIFCFSLMNDLDY